MDAPLRRFAVDRVHNLPLQAGEGRRDLGVGPGAAEHILHDGALSGRLLRLELEGGADPLCRLLP